MQKPTEKSLKVYIRPVFQTYFSQPQPTLHPANIIHMMNPPRPSLFHKFMYIVNAMQTEVQKCGNEATVILLMQTL